MRKMFLLGVFLSLAGLLLLNGCNNQSEDQRQSISPSAEETAVTVPEGESAESAESGGPGGAPEMPPEGESAESAESGGPGGAPEVVAPPEDESAESAESGGPEGALGGPQGEVSDVFTAEKTAAPAGISGKWALTMKSPMGQDESFNLDIKAAGENLSITCSDHPFLQTLEGTGTLKGNAITMDLKATGQMAVEIVFTGNVAGNKMSGTREIKMGGRGAPPGGGERGAPPEGESAESAESGGPGGAP